MTLIMCSYNNISIYLPKCFFSTEMQIRKTVTMTIDSGIKGVLFSVPII